MSMSDKLHKFAEHMSQLLLEMREEDLNNSMIITEDGEQIPTDFIDKILDDSVHTAQIKKRIREDIIKTVLPEPLKYFNSEEGEYRYTADTYDHAYLVDHYIEEMYDDGRTRTVYICPQCQSDRVQVKAWVRPNKGYEFVDEVNEGDEVGWCEDEELSTFIETAEVKLRAKVVGFQVVGEDGTVQEGEIHPNMDGSFCIYSLPQARAMLDDNNNGNEQWRLLTIWSGDVEEPTFMFEGDPRDPEECTPSDGTVGSL